MSDAQPRTSVLFVCLGNICRSPAAEGVFRRLVESEGLASALIVDSAGTSAHHVGEPADPRMRRAAEARGHELTSRSRQVEPADFARFDLLVAMDRQNQRDLEARDPGGGASIRLLSDFLDLEAQARRPVDVPDPYYGGAQGFEVVLDMIEEAAPGLLAHLKT
ncbi:MAG: low molecular weight protein-tyrosine-phosphatase [Acidobacteriota bacterium]